LSSFGRGDLEAMLHATVDSLQRSYLFDSTTGLLHRELFLDRLDQAASSVSRGGASFGVVLLGVTAGPLGAALPSLHTALGHRLKACGRHSDSFSHLEPGLFAGLLLGNHSVSGCVGMAHKLAEQLSNPVVLEGRQYPVRVNVGVAVCPQHGMDAHRVLVSAHAAMVHAQSNGQDVAVYAAALPERR
jgi:GGDEF domain-containing protein